MAGASALASVVGWVPLAIPPRFINELARGLGTQGIFGLCTSLKVGSLEMLVCSALVGLMAIALGPLVVGIALFIFRRGLTKLLRRLIKKLPVTLQPLGGPVVATLAFVVGWAGIHHSTWRTWGLLPHILFPVVVGIFTYITTRHLPAIQTRLGAFFAWRDKLPKLVRWGLVFVIPAGASVMLITIFSEQGRVLQEALVEQLTCIIALGTGFLALVPRQGDLLSAAKRELEQGRAA